VTTMTMATAVFHVTNLLSC